MSTEKTDDFADSVNNDNDLDSQNQELTNAELRTVSGGFLNFNAPTIPAGNSYQGLFSGDTTAQTALYQGGQPPVNPNMYALPSEPTSWVEGVNYTVGEYGQMIPK